MSYNAITAMLGSDDQLDCLADEFHPAALQQQPSDASSLRANTSGVQTVGSAFTDHAEVNGSNTEKSALDLPSVPASSASPARLNIVQAGHEETEEDLLARYTALKASTAAPAEDLNTLTDRLVALKGPKVTAAELQDLQSRFEGLKGPKSTVLLSELEGRLAKLKGTSPAPIGQLSQLERKSDRQLIPDFDPDVELNQEQLEALASVGDSYAENSSFEKYLRESTEQQQPPVEPAPGNVAAATPMDLQQVLQDFDPEDEDYISEQQLRALASMPSKGAAGTPQCSEGVPPWAAALGLSAQDLQHVSEPEDCLQSDSCSSDSGGSRNRLDANAKGRRSLASSAAKQTQLKRLTRQKPPHKRRN